MFRYPESCSYLQMLPTQLNGNIFLIPLRDSKVRRTALVELKIENLHFATSVMRLSADFRTWYIERH